MDLNNFAPLAEQSTFPEFSSSREYAREIVDAWIIESENKYREIYAEMRKISLATKKVDGKAFLLEMHTTTTVALRWRLSSGKHVHWENIEPLLAKLNSEMRAWYINLATQGLILNARASSIRQEIKNAKKVKEGRVFINSNNKRALLIPFLSYK